jgi:hypothetical protein
MATSVKATGPTPETAVRQALSAAIKALEQAPDRRSIEEHQYWTWDDIFRRPALALAHKAMAGQVEG